MPMPPALNAGRAGAAPVIDAPSAHAASTETESRPSANRVAFMGSVLWLGFVFQGAWKNMLHGAPFAPVVQYYELRQFYTRAEGRVSGAHTGHIESVRAASIPMRVVP
jgi:hypothetical protein